MDKVVGTSYVPSGINVKDCGRFLVLAIDFVRNLHISRERW